MRNTIHGGAPMRNRISRTGIRAAQLRSGGTPGHLLSRGWPFDGEDLQVGPSSAGDVPWPSEPCRTTHTRAG